MEGGTAIPEDYSALKKWGIGLLLALGVFAVYRYHLSKQHKPILFQGEHYEHVLAQDDNDWFAQHFFTVGGASIQKADSALQILRLSSKLTADQLSKVDRRIQNLQKINPLEDAPDRYFGILGAFVMYGIAYQHHYIIFLTQHHGEDPATLKAQTMQVTDEMDQISVVGL